MGFIVAIDGEAGSGKSSTAKKVAEILGFTYIDTGAMFRCVTLELMRNNIGINEIGKIEEVLNKISIDFKNDKDMQRVILNGVDVSEDIRTKKVDDKVAEYATVGAIYSRRDRRPSSRMRCRRTRPERLCSKRRRRRARRRGTPRVRKPCSRCRR